LVYNIDGLKYKAALKNSLHSSDGEEGAKEKFLNYE
jgi:hypothetical protein